MSRRAVMLGVIVSAALLRFTGCPSSNASKPPVRPPLILVFADVTDSLEGGEPGEVHAAIHDIFDRAPERATVVVYPVVPVMAYVKPLSKSEIPLRSSSSKAAMAKHAELRANLAKQTVGELETTAAALQPNVPSSCLAGALLRAAEEIQGVTNRPIELVFLSDMVEECRQSIGGRRMILNHPGIAAEIRVATQFQGTYANLKHANVSFIYPSASNTGLDVDRPRPDPEELKEFWRAVLFHCTVGRVSFHSGTSLFRPDWKSARKLAGETK